MTRVLPKIYAAIDTPDVTGACDLARRLAGAGCGIKLGMEFFNANGPQGIETIQKSAPGISLFIDLKYHDIPNTVAGALRSIARLAPDFVNVHASGGPAMMTAGLDALRDESAKRGIQTPKLLAVTVLTSMDDAAVAAVGWQLPVADQVKRLALLTQKAGLDGVVCSPLEVAMVRETCGPGFVTMVPGIRPGADAGSPQTEGFGKQNRPNNNDQKRVMTPKEAVAAGATHLVIGRPITQAPDPANAAADIIASL
ncbi:MAG: orotidine-5'-phosphate decarboxylase [Rhodospirillales bacterium]|nr:orotidine-5'-phosphate decarboxylase [Alphaproteobacteria bacterium]MCB9986699.1 orotidine-5'-phosphate decarboxylase [Rhodospirillales bacterium]USO06776.1 MAG: orotidine-5'-phosphate decarboxylase [Rhodospirillales bacterium]